MPPPFRLKVDLSAPEQFQVNAAEFCKQLCGVLIIFDTLGDFVLISFRDRIQLGLPIVIRRKVQALVAFAIGTSAVRLAAFDGPGDQGSPHDAGRIRHCVEDFLTAGFESVSGYGFIRVCNLISAIHDKIIPQGAKKVHPVVGEKAYLYSSSASSRRDFMASASK